MNTNYTFTRGQAVLFVGPSEGDKITVAKKLAEPYGDVAIADAGLLEERHGIANILLDHPVKTLIIDGLPDSAEGWKQVKTLLSNNQVACPRKGRRLVMRDMPHLIFCTGTLDALPPDIEQRRFYIVDAEVATRGHAKAEATREKPPLEAQDILDAAHEAIGDRAASRDVDKERSMARTVATFNALTGHQLTEVQGWQFMATLKLARAQGGRLNMDDYIDGAAYMALAGECAKAGQGSGQYIDPAKEWLAKLHFTQDAQ